MRLVLLGPPGVGKGSLASWSARHLGLRHISTGEIFRRQIKRRTPLGRRVQHYVSTGGLVPDALVVQVMAAQLTPALLGKGFVLDGFPRTRGQAAGLDRALARRRSALDGAVLLEGPRALLIRRLSGRRVCPTCGANYHVRTMRPKRAGRCDVCATPLVIRKDDEPRTIAKRLAVDRAAAKPLIAYYARRGLLHRISAAGTVRLTFARLQRLIRTQGWGA